MSKENIPFQVELTRIIELLAKQIYQSPMALLRENCQNAFDAILMRKAVDTNFGPRIDIHLDVNQKEISVEDNGIGMSREVLKNNFWKAGSSGKNNPAARQAGVVGTFGIGAMANFGIAEELIVHTKSMESNETIISIAEKAKLSASENCISIESTEDRKDFGTMITAKVRPDVPLNLIEAKNYISSIVKFSNIPIYFNNELISTNDITSAEPRPKDPEWEEESNDVQISPSVKCNVDLAITKGGDVWLSLTDIFLQGSKVNGEIILRQNVRQISTFRSKFALAPASVSSLYGFGGIANLSLLEPTAGREALTTGSIQTLQNIISEVENFISLKISETEAAAKNTSFLNWIIRTGRYELAKNVEINLSPPGKKKLKEVQTQSQTTPVNIFHGNEQTIIDQFSSEANPLILVSSSNPRRAIEDNFLKKYCKINIVDTNPKVLSLKSERTWSDSESSFALRLTSILEADYFVATTIKFGQISHNLPILINVTTQPIDIVLNSSHASIETFLRMYNSDFLVMSGVAKDFVRNTIFPKIGHLVPSSTRRGAEAFLKAIKGPKDIFEYEKSDSSGLSEIWQDYMDGKITLPEAAHRSTSIVRDTVQIVDRSQTGKVSDVIPDVVTNQKIIEETTSKTDPFQALPAIARIDIEVPFKLLTMGQNEQPLNGYTCFLAISERARSDRGDFFLQPHRTEVIWGGQKVLFIFQHHSGEFGLYYELKSSELISPTSSGGEKTTSTIILKNRIFIPIPEEIKGSFIPDGEGKKSFEVRCELLFPDSSKNGQKP